MEDLIKRLKDNAVYNYRCYAVTSHPNEENASYWQGYLKCAKDIEAFFRQSKKTQSEDKKDYTQSETVNVMTLEAFLSKLGVTYTLDNGIVVLRDDRKNIMNLCSIIVMSNQK